MEYRTNPIGMQVYEENKYSQEEAYRIMEKAREENACIICKIIGYDKGAGKTFIEFYGNEGVVDRGHISQSNHVDIDYFIGKAIGVHITEID